MFSQARITFFFSLDMCSDPANLLAKKLSDVFVKWTNSLECPWDVTCMPEFDLNKVSNSQFDSNLSPTSEWLMMHDFLRSWALFPKPHIFFFYERKHYGNWAVKPNNSLPIHKPSPYWSLIIVFFESRWARWCCCWSSTRSNTFVCYRKYLWSCPWCRNQLGHSWELLVRFRVSKGFAII